MKAAEVLTYSELYDKIWDAEDENREAVKKLLLDEVGARQAWKVIECLDQFKGFEEGFWMMGGEMPEECRDNMFNELANLFRDEPHEIDE